MDSRVSWRLQPVAEPVSYFDAATRQWTSGSFETAVKSEHPAVVTSSDTTAAASSAFAAAAQHGSASTPALDPWDGMHRTSGHMPTTSATDAAQKWLNALIWGAKGSAPLADDEADGSYHRQYDRQHDPQGANRVAIRGGSGYAGQVHDGEHPGSGTASWDGAWCSFEHGGVSTLEQSHR